MLPWYCPECFRLLGGPEITRAQAVERLRVHERAGHGKRYPNSDSSEALLKDEVGHQEHDVPAEQLSFELLPPGTWDIDHLIDHYRREANNLPADLKGRDIQWTRLSALRSLTPTKCYIGKELWLGYVVFEFPNSARVVLECPIEGNATYVLSGDWKAAIQHTKMYLRQQPSHLWTKVVHKGNWLARIRAAL